MSRPQRRSKKGLSKVLFGDEIPKFEKESFVMAGEGSGEHVTPCQWHGSGLVVSQLVFEEEM